MIAQRMRLRKSGQWSSGAQSEWQTWHTPTHVELVLRRVEARNDCGETLADAPTITAQIRCGGLVEFEVGTFGSL